MTVKEQLAYQKNRRTELQTNLADIKSRLDELYAEKEGFEKKIKILETRTSALAKELLEDSKREIRRLERSIAEVQGEANTIKQFLEKTESNISEMEEHTTLYIQEQVKRMIAEVFNYIQNHSKKIGLDIKRTFQIKDGENLSKTIGVFDGETQVTVTKDFYFTGDCYLRNALDPHANFTKTLWYSEYCKDFQKAFNKMLKESWPYNSTFKLTINGTTFTLELV